jgi:hypothetical protein
MNEQEKKLSELHNSLTNKLLERIQDPEVKASDLNVARQFLKDNGIECQPHENNAISRLAQELPFSLEDVLEATNDTKN